MISKKTDAQMDTAVQPEVSLAEQCASFEAEYGHLMQDCILNLCFEPIYDPARLSRCLEPESKIVSLFPQLSKNVLSSKMSKKQKETTNFLKQIRQLIDRRKLDSRGWSIGAGLSVGVSEAPYRWSGECEQEDWQSTSTGGDGFNDSEPFIVLACAGTDEKLDWESSGWSSLSSVQNVLLPLERCSSPLARQALLASFEQRLR